MDGYTLSRQWFDFSFENPDKMAPDHTAIYLFAVEMWNRFGQKEKFGFPSYHTMEVLGIKNYRTYKKYFDDLVEWGFLKIIQESKNQYSSCIIALVKNTKAHTKALDKAHTMHIQKQSEGTAVIDKQINKETIKPLNQETDTIVSGEQALVVSSEKSLKVDNRNQGTQRIIDIVKNQIEHEGFLYDNNKEERNRATIIAKRQSDWGSFIKETPEDREEEIIRQIVAFSLQNEFVSKIQSVRDFHEKWKKVANSMKQEKSKVEKENDRYFIPKF